MEKDYEIKPEWVANVIDDGGLVEEIKEKYTFTFYEVYEAREDSSIFDKDHWKRFYKQVHEHFKDPNFKDRSANPFINFKRASTEHVPDHLHNRYFHDEENDQLYKIVRRKQRAISLGNCKELLQENLQDLIKQYYDAIKNYNYTKEIVDDLFAKRDDDLDEASSGKERLNLLDYYDVEFYKEALPERKHAANQVSKLYFVISKK